jgi:hypothetical protein
MQHAIVVAVPEAREDCFVAIPSNASFRDLFNDITQAAADLSLRRVCVRSGEMQRAPEFMTDICDATRSARIVVAVCSPDPGKRGMPNPNVMYELGYAHALGKPTLILTCDPASLPADLKSMHVLEYSRDEMGTLELVRRIRDAMRSVRERMVGGNPLTDPTYGHIYVTRGRQLAFHKAAFWECFRRILSFARLVHEHQQIDMTFVEEFFNKVTVMWMNSGQQQPVLDVGEAWRKYERYYQIFTEPSVYQQLPVRKEEVEHAFGAIANEGGDDLAAQVSDCENFYRKLCEQMEQYQDVFRETGEYVEHDSFAGSQQDLGVVQKLYSRARKLSTTSSAIVRFSDRIIVNLIRMTQAPGE